MRKGAYHSSLGSGSSFSSFWSECREHWIGFVDPPKEQTSALTIIFGEILVSKSPIRTVGFFNNIRTVDLNVIKFCDLVFYIGNIFIIHYIKCIPPPLVLIRGHRGLSLNRVKDNIFKSLTIGDLCKLHVVLLLYLLCFIVDFRC